MGYNGSKIMLSKTMLPFTVYRLPFTIRYPLSFSRYRWLMAKGECKVNGRGLMVNGAAGGGVL